ncbi:MAG: hypothetical protein ACYCW6_29320, partial [Candidatus Xenobia bacterium]
NGKPVMTEHQMQFSGHGTPEPTQWTQVPIHETVLDSGHPYTEAVVPQYTETYSGTDNNGNGVNFTTHIDPAQGQGTQLGLAVPRYIVDPGSSNGNSQSYGWLNPSGHGATETAHVGSTVTESYSGTDSNGNGFHETVHLDPTNPLNTTAVYDGTDNNGNHFHETLTANGPADTIYSAHEH